MTHYIGQFNLTRVFIKEFYVFRKFHIFLAWAPTSFMVLAVSRISVKECYQKLGNSRQDFDSFHHPWGCLVADTGAQMDKFSVARLRMSIWAPASATAWVITLGEATPLPNRSWP